MVEVCLISGGVDSTIALWTLMNAPSREVILPVFVDYGQPYAEQELRACEKITEYLGIKDAFIVIKSKLEQLNPDFGSFVPNRNLTLCSLVSTYLKPKKIYLSGLLDDNIKDNNTNAYELISFTLSKFCDDPVVVESNTISLTKGQLIEQFLKLGGSKELLDLCFSCFSPQQNGLCCNNCPACFRKFVAYRSNGLDVPDINLEIVKTYLKNLFTYHSDRISRTLIALKTIINPLYAIDIDGILCEENTDDFEYENRKPFIDNINHINDLIGFKLIFTSRLEKDRGITVNWLNRHNIDYDCLIMNKPPFDYIIDDRILIL